MKEASTDVRTTLDCRIEATIIGIAFVVWCAHSLSANPGSLNQRRSMLSPDIYSRLLPCMRWMASNLDLFLINEVFRHASYLRRPNDPDCWPAAVARRAENSDFPVIEPRLSRYRGKIIDIVSFTIIERSGVTTTTDWQYYAI